jgi:hypothetical protein
MPTGLEDLTAVADDRPDADADMAGSDGGGVGSSVGEAASRAMLLGPAEIGAPGWNIVEERVWPTGGLDSTSGKSKRALEAGCITVWRSMARTDPTRSAWVEVVPYASPEDALVSLQQVPTFFVGTGPADEEIEWERTVDDLVVPGVADTWIFEKSTTGPGGKSHARYVGGTVHRILFLVCLSDPEAARPWDEVLAVATMQADRVRAALGVSPPG